MVKSVIESVSSLTGSSKLSVGKIVKHHHFLNTTVFRVLNIAGMIFGLGLVVAGTVLVCVFHFPPLYMSLICSGFVIMMICLINLRRSVFAGYLNLRLRDFSQKNYEKKLEAEKNRLTIKLNNLNFELERIRKESEGIMETLPGIQEELPILGGFGEMDEDALKAHRILSKRLQSKLCEINKLRVELESLNKKKDFLLSRRSEIRVSVDGIKVISLPEMKNIFIADLGIILNSHRSNSEGVGVWDECEKKLHDLSVSLEDELNKTLSSKNELQIRLSELKDKCVAIRSNQLKDRGIQCLFDDVITVNLVVSDEDVPFRIPKGKKVPADLSDEKVLKDYLVGDPSRRSDIVNMTGEEVYRQLSNLEDRGFSSLDNPGWSSIEERVISFMRLRESVGNIRLDKSSIKERDLLSQEVCLRVRKILLETLKKVSFEARSDFVTARNRVCEELPKELLSWISRDASLDTSSWREIVAAADFNLLCWRKTGALPGQLMTSCRKFQCRFSEILNNIDTIRCAYESMIRHKCAEEDLCGFISDDISISTLFRVEKDFWPNIGDSLTDEALEIISKDLTEKLDQVNLLISQERSSHSEREQACSEYLREESACRAVASILPAIIKILEDYESILEGRRCWDQDRREIRVLNNESMIGTVRSQMFLMDEIQWLLNRVNSKEIVGCEADCDLAGSQMKVSLLDGLTQFLLCNDGLSLDDKAALAKVRLKYLECLYRESDQKSTLEAIKIGSLEQVSLGLRKSCDDVTDLLLRCCEDMERLDGSDKDLVEETKVQIRELECSLETELRIYKGLEKELAGLEESGTSSKIRKQLRLESISESSENKTIGSSSSELSVNELYD